MSSVVTSSQSPPCLASSSRTVDQESLFNETLENSLTTSRYVSSSTSSPLFCITSSPKAVEADADVIEEKEEPSSPIIICEEKEEPSSPIIICEICVEAKNDEEMFRIQRGYHSFCSECVVKQVATKIQDNITVVSCPGLNCRGVLELEILRPLLPKELIGRWDDAMCEALLLTVLKILWPF